MRVALGLPYKSLIVAALFAVCIAACSGDEEPPSLDEPAADAAPTADASAADASDDGGVDADDDGESDAEIGADASEMCRVGEVECIDSTTIERCVDVSGEGPTLRRETCRQGGQCRSGSVRAACELVGPCETGTATCSDGSTLATCELGHFVYEECGSECLSTPFGAQCAAAVRTHVLKGRVEFEYRLPNEQRTDWAAVPVRASARGFLLLAYRGDELVDVAVTGTEAMNEGMFEVRVPAEPGAGDSLVVMAAAADATGQLAYAVADPGFPPSVTQHANDELMPNAELWSWRFPLASHSAEVVLTIGEAQGAAAAFTFDSVRDVAAVAERFFKPSGIQAIVAWLGIGVLWRCAVCTTQQSATHFGRVFGHQIRLDGSTDEAYWSEPVTRHELGHYVMNAYGLSPRETGPHYFGEPTNPGQAWSEGWATFFSATERDSTVYYDKQAGGFFWFDIDARHYAFDDLAWQRPVAANGLTQLLDENEVASMLWQSFELVGTRVPFLEALHSARMTMAPFERGYRRRTWTDRDHPEIYTETDVSVPHLADFFDAMLCVGSISASQLDAVTEPATRYPYPSGSPLCR